MNEHRKGFGAEVDLEANELLSKIIKLFIINFFCVLFAIFDQILALNE
jgi:hypothetical protein